MNETIASVSDKRRAGHYEILGETLAKFEFFQQGWNPYERYLDIDKVDLIIRRTIQGKPVYREIQVKYGKLYDCGEKWAQSLFDVTSWRFFKRNEFSSFVDRQDFFIAYILAHDSGYNGDIFIFPVEDFSYLISQSIPSKDAVKMYLSRSKEDSSRWFLRLKSSFIAISPDSCIEVTKYRRNFQLLT